MQGNKVKNSESERPRMRSGNFIDNLPSHGTGDPVTLIDPATGKELETFSQSSPGDVDRAVASAAAAAEGWARRTPRDRSRLLLAWADNLEAHAAELTDLEVAETGRPRRFMRDVEVGIAADNLRYLAGISRGLQGSGAGRFAEGYDSVLHRRPIGVVAGIVPWNFPLIIAIWKAGPALAAGNTMVIKPAPNTPGSMLLAARLGGEVGLPDGVLNVVTGGASVGAALVSHPRVGMVSVTGSTATGKSVMRLAAEAPKRVQLELGGKGSAIVFDDADLDEMAQCVTFAAVYNTGQDCTAATRLYVHRSVFDAAVARVQSVMSSSAVGDPDDPEAIVGPLISTAQRDRVQGFVDRAVAAGATIVVGGRSLDRPGFYFEPTLIVDASQSSEIVQEEVFGPVLVVLPFDGEDEAIQLANGTSYGLASSVWTRDGARAARISSQLKVGVTWINDHLPLTSEMPHGGVKQSGFGRDMGEESLLEWTSTHHVMSRYSPGSSSSDAVRSQD